MFALTWYDRFFSQATASPGDEIAVTFKIFFIAPQSNPGIWFNNVGDNLGGSTLANGPLIASSQPALQIRQNVTVHSFHEKSSGEVGARGCYRFWCDGSTYPGPNNYHNDVFHATSNPDPCSLAVVKTFTVHHNAVPGTVIGPPTRVTPCSDTNYDAGEMIDLGPNMSPFIILTTPPQSTWSRTLTII